MFLQALSACTPAQNHGNAWARTWGLVTLAWRPKMHGWQEWPESEERLAGAPACANACTGASTHFSSTPANFSL